MLARMPTYEDWLSRKEAARYLTSIGCPISERSLAVRAINNNEGRGPSRRSNRRVKGKLMDQVQVWKWRVTQRTFNKGCAAAFATLLCALCIGILWLCGIELDVIGGAIWAFVWTGVYRKTGGDPLNYPSRD